MKFQSSPCLRKGDVMGGLCPSTNEMLIEIYEKLQALAINLINKFELCVYYDKHDLINSAFIKLSENKYNSPDHLCGSMYNTMKFICLSEVRSNKRTIGYDANIHNTYLTVEFNDNDNSEIVRQSILEETNLKHQQLLLLAGQGYPYDLIAKEVGISRKTIRFHLCKAKGRLIERLKSKGVFIKNRKRMDAFITQQYKSDNYPLYNDFPIHNHSFMDAIFFVLTTEKRVIEKSELLGIIAKNKGLLVENCKAAFKHAIEKMSENGKIVVEGCRVNLP